MMKRLFFPLFCAMATFAQSGGQAVGIPIQNPSFLLGDSGWQIGAGSGTTQTDCNGNALGVTAAYAGYGSSFSQLLTTTPKSLQEFQPNHYTDGIYILQFDARSCFVSYPGYYIVEIRFGSQELCDASLGWPTRSFQRVMMICLAHAYIVENQALPGGGGVQSGMPFVLKLTANDGSSNGGWPVLARNFVFSFMPTN